MRRVALALLPGFLFFASPVLAQNPQHPRLLFTSADIPGLQAKVQDGVGPDDQAFLKLIEIADQFRCLSYPGTPLYFPVTETQATKSSALPINSWTYRTPIGTPIATSAARWRWRCEVAPCRKTATATTAACASWHCPMPSICVSKGRHPTIARTSSRPSRR